MAQVSIQTTQNVNVNYHIADVGDRILGWFIDTLIKIAYIIVFYGFFFTYMGHGGSNMLIVFLLFLPPAFYTVAMEYFLNGQTLGKKVARTRVIRLDGGEAKLGNYIIRWLFKIVDEFFFIGLITAAVSQKCQRIGDIVAGTVVIKLKKTTSFQFVLPQIPVDDEYHIVFPQVSKLNDNDIRIVREAYANAKRTGNYLLLDSLARKTRDVLTIESNLSDSDFISTIINDYNYYHSDPANSFARRE